MTDEKVRGGGEAIFPVTIEGIFVDLFDWIWEGMAEVDAEAVGGEADACLRVCWDC